MHLPKLNRASISLVAAASVVVLITGCQRRETDVEIGNRTGVLHLGLGAEPRDLDPTTNNGIAEIQIMGAIFEGLVNLSADGKTILPGAAERWEVSTDGLTLTFYLRPGLKWGNGDPLTADDFLYGFRRILEPTVGSEGADKTMPVVGARDYVAGLNKDPNSVGFRVVDPLTFEIKLEHPAPYFLGELVYDPFVPLHRPTMEKFKAYLRRDTKWTRAGNMIGNGAFRLKSWQPNESVVVEKNPLYWDAARVRLREVHFHSIDNADAEEIAFRGGRLHGTNSLATTKAENYRVTKSPFFRAEPALTTMWIAFNVTKPPFNDPRVRRAFALAIDRTALARDVMRGMLPADTIVVDGAGGFPSRVQLKRDPERARALLTEAGFPDGRGFPAVTLPYTGPRRDVCEAIQFMWQKELGVRVELAQTERKVWLDALRSHDFQFILTGWTSQVDDAVEWFGTFLSESPNNVPLWTNAEYDKRFVESERALTPAARFEQFHAMEAMLHQEMPVLPLYYGQRRFLLQTSLRGWESNPLNHHPVKDLWLEAGAGGGR